MIKPPLAIFALFCITPLQAFTLTLSSDDFGVTPEFSSVTRFNFEIEIDEVLQAGMTYINPAISFFEYEIRGNLAPNTPSGFPGFLLTRTMDGTEFYAQGSSLTFAVSASADLSNGLQISELSGSNSIFTLNAREFDTGRYHPSLFELNADGTGTVQNSNNSGPTRTNPSSGELVDIDFGDEYISNLTFDPANTTIGVPEPSSALLLSFSSLLLLRRARH